MKKKLLFGVLTTSILSTTLIGCGQNDDNPWGKPAQELGEIKEDTEEKSTKPSEEIKEQGEKTEESTQIENNNISTNNTKLNGIDLSNYIGKTISEFVLDYPDFSDNGYSGVNGIYTFMLVSSDNNIHINITANCNSNEVEALGSIFDRDINDMFEIAHITDINVLDTDKLSEEAKQYEGQPISAMINDGYSITGYVYAGENVTLYLNNNSDITVYAAIGTIENFDENNYEELYLDNIIENIQIKFF